MPKLVEVLSWARYAEGIDEQGGPITIVDRLKDELMDIAANNQQDPLAFIRNRSVFSDLIDNPIFVTAYLNAMKLLHTKGAKQTIISLNKELLCI